MNSKFFGKTKEGKEAFLYTISNSQGMEVCATDFGATVVSIFVKDKDGNRRDVVLGYDDVSDYQKGTSYFGATVGRNCNRISNAKVTIDGTEYPLEANDRGNNLHSGSNAVSEQIWSVASQEENRITFHYTSPDLSEGFPGTAEIDVTFEVTEDNSLAIHYHAVSDKKTVFNFTNHCYFNLNGHDGANVLDHVLEIHASHYTPVSSNKAIPTGEIAEVEGTPFDFRTAKRIGQDIEADHEQLSYGGGYDHNFALDRTGDGVEKMAEIYSPESGIHMDVLTDRIGMQLFTMNFIGGHPGKGGISYNGRASFCLETQFFPNAINEPNFVTPLTDAGEAFDSRTVYHFSVSDK